MENVVVTGGAGFIGSHVVDALVADGYEVHVVDTLVAGKAEFVNPAATLHKVDIRDSEKLKELFVGIDTVFHLAALPRVQGSIDDPVGTHAVNVDGTLAVLQAAHQCGVGRVVFSSSSAVYGTQTSLPLTESQRANPESPYALHKRVGEMYCALYSKVYGLPTVSLRYFNAYGPRLDPEGPYALVIGKFLKQKKEGTPITITGDGEQTRDFVHVADIVRGNILAATSDAVGAGEVINLGTGIQVSVNTLAALVGGPTVHIPPRLEPRHVYADHARAKELLGWESTIPFNDGIAEFLK